MAYTIKSDIVVPSMYVYNASRLQPGFHQIHLHSTGNPNSSVQNERDYLAGHYTSANYTHLVGITNGQVDIRQVMNTNGGAWDVGGDWNWETWGAIEFVEGSIKSKEDFNKAYPAYIWLARYLAKQAGIPYTIDNQNIAGIKTHNYASATGHGSDHVDPIPFLANWGVSRSQLYSDIVNGTKTADEGNYMAYHDFSKVDKSKYYTLDDTKKTNHVEVIFRTGTEVYSDPTYTNKYWAFYPKGTKVYALDIQTNPSGKATRIKTGQGWITGAKNVVKIS